MSELRVERAQERVLDRATLCLREYPEKFFLLP